MFCLCNMDITLLKRAFLFSVFTCNLNLVVCEMHFVESILKLKGHSVHLLMFMVFKAAVQR